ncbi:acyl carrier protein [Paenibacillus sp. FJAT-26967]|uniref:acyl carrier protein n=1 Tax=Paenibacillus sp. FJAT-26967 TaxID=1729690 RepID=UPI000838380C|nr:acyl carrier protein [Paenibacillus sp. FJAT-26967]
MFEKIIDILCEIKGEDLELRDNLTPATDLNNDVGLDSLQMIQFMLKIEERLNITIDYDEFDYIHLESIGSFIEFLQSCESKNHQYEDVKQ